MPDLTLQLGDFVFADFEIPESIDFGGDQMISVHRLVGGVRVVDAMGPDDEPLTWSGRFRGPDALTRALYVDGLRKAGKALSLTWSSLSYLVVIKSFKCSFQRFYELPYTITCETVQDNTVPITTLPAITVDDQVGADMATASDYGDAISDPNLTSNLDDITTAIAAVPSLLGATMTQIASILAPISVAQAAASVLISTNDNLIGSVSTFGGVVSGGDPLSLAASLTGQGAAMEALDSLYGLSDVLGRMSVNLQADGASGIVLTQAGGSLYDVASRVYGDPSEWTTIAQANGLSDPSLTGINTLRIPAQPSGDGGVWAT